MLEKSVQLHEQQTLSNAFAQLENEHTQIQQVLDTGKVVQKGLKVAKTWRKQFLVASKDIEEQYPGKYPEIVKLYHTAADRFAVMISELNAYASVGQVSIEMYQARISDLEDYFNNRQFGVAKIHVDVMEKTLGKLLEHSKGVQNHTDNFIQQTNLLREKLSIVLKEAKAKGGDYTNHIVSGAVTMMGVAGGAMTAANLATLALVGISPLTALGVNGVVMAVGGCGGAWAEKNRLFFEGIKTQFEEIDHHMADTQFLAMGIDSRVRTGDHNIRAGQGALTEIKMLADTLNKYPVHIVISPQERNMISTRVETAKAQMGELHNLYVEISHSSLPSHYIKSGSRDGGEPGSSDYQIDDAGPDIRDEL